MTTTTTPTPAEVRPTTPLPSFVANAKKNKALADFVVPARGEGTGTYGMLVQAAFGSVIGDDFRVNSQLDYFIMRSRVYVMRRRVDAKKGNWRLVAERATPTEALAVLQGALDRAAVRVVGSPVLVELAADDISAYETRQLPNARWRARKRHEKLYGAFNDSGTLHAPVPLPAALLAGV